MNIIFENPPNLEDILKVLEPTQHTIFTYGDTIYNPNRCFIDPFVLKHEEVHTKQQTNPKEWWARYLVDTTFRLEMELEAYKAQYSFFKASIKNRNTQFNYALRLSRELSSPMYGGIITQSEALQRIINN